MNEEEYECPECYGVGLIDTKWCDRCGGSGIAHDETEN